MTARDPSMRPRRYSFGDHGGSDMGGRPGNFVIKGNVADYYSPSYADNATTTIRIFPGWNDDRTGPGAYRYSAEPNQFGDFIRRYPAVRNMGEPGVTFLTSDPADPGRVDPQMLPASILYNAIRQAIKNGQEQPGWAAQLEGGPGQAAKLSAPSEVYLVQGAIFQRGNETYNPPRGFAQDHKPVVFAMSPSAGMTLLDQLNAVREGADISGTDWNQIMANGDPVDLNTGRYVTFYRLRDGDPRQRQQQAQAGWNIGGQAGPGGLGGGRQQQPIGYGCYLEETFGGQPAALAQYADFIMPRVLPWDDILHFPTPEEQAHLLADKFPASMILYAWNDHPDWIPDSVRAAAVNRTTHPGAGMPPGPPAQPPGPPGLTPPPAPPTVGPPATPTAAPPLPPSSAPALPSQGVPPQATPPTMAPPPGPATPPPQSAPPQYAAPPAGAAPPQGPPPQMMPPAGAQTASPPTAPPQGPPAQSAVPPSGTATAVPPAPTGTAAPSQPPAGGPPPATAQPSSATTEQQAAHTSNLLAAAQAAAGNNG